MIVAFSIVCKMTSKDSGTIGQGILSNKPRFSVLCFTYHLTSDDENCNECEGCMRGEKETKKTLFISLVSNVKWEMETRQKERRKSELNSANIKTDS